MLIRKCSQGAQHSTRYSSLHQLFLICSIISNIPTSVHMSLQFQEYNISSTFLCLLRYSMHNICNLNVQWKDHICLFTYVYILSQKAVSAFQFNLVIHDHNHSHFSLYKTHCQLRYIPCTWNTFQLKWTFNNIQANKKSSTSAFFGFTRHNCVSFTSKFLFLHLLCPDNRQYTTHSNTPPPWAS